MISVGVAEDPEQQIGLPEPELEEPLAELAAEGSSAHADPLLSEDLPHGGAQDLALPAVEILGDPLQHRLAPGVVFVELEAVGHRRDDK